MNSLNEYYNIDNSLDRVREYLTDVRNNCKDKSELIIGIVDQFVIWVFDVIYRSIEVDDYTIEHKCFRVLSHLSPYNPDQIRQLINNIQFLRSSYTLNI